jgi:hypothetical protein
LTIGINGAWGIRENINISAEDNLSLYELKQHKYSFDEICSAVIYKRKQGKVQWLQHPRQINGGSVNHLEHKLCIFFI